MKLPMSQYTAFVDSHLTLTGTNTEPQRSVSLCKPSNIFAEPMEREIMEEVRRRLLEAEVRREEVRRELMLQEFTNGHMSGYPHYGSVSSRDHLHEVIAREMERERIRAEITRRHLAMESDNDRGLSFMRPAALLEDATSQGNFRMMLDGGKEGESGVGTRMGTLQLQTQAQSQGVPDNMLISNGVNGKPRVMLMGPKPDEAASGSKGKRPGSPQLGEVENTKKPKKDWTCQLCKISSTSEKALADHLNGKKHKDKEAAASGCSGENRVAPNRHKYWCDMCKWGSYKFRCIEQHKKGKLHIRRLHEAGIERVRYTRDMLIQLQEAVGQAPEDILKVKEEVEAVFVEEAEHPTYYSEVVRGAISVGLEKSPACVNLVLSFLTSLFGGKVVDGDSIGGGCLLYAESLEEIPKAPDSFGEIVGGLVLVGILEFKDVKEILERVGDDFYGKAVFGGVMKFVGSGYGGRELLEEHADYVKELESVF